MFESLFSRRGLSLDRLRSFLEMAEAGGIAGAAPGDPVRQSQISRQVRELEEFFGTELTRRQGKGLVLTPAGERLAALVRNQLRDLEDFRREQASRPKAFTLCAGASTLEWLVTPCLPAVAEALGGAVVRTELRRSRSLVEAVRDGRVDFGVVRRDAVPGASRANTLPVRKLSFHLCAPRRLLPNGTKPDDLTHPDLWQELPFAAGRDGGQLDRAIRDGMEAAGIDYRPRFECGSILAVRQLVDRGGCAAILPDIALTGLDRRRILAVPFAPLKSYGRTLVLHWNPRAIERRGVEMGRLRAVARILSEARGGVPPSG